MNFENILASLGETGELGESPRQRLITDEAKKGEFALAQEAKAQNSPLFAPNSPCLEASPIVETRPIRPIRPDEADEIVRLVKICGSHYGFTEQEFTEAITAALNDYEAALICYRSIVREHVIVLQMDDDRRTCSQCANLAGRRCLAAWRGAIVASRSYEPVRDVPRRCEGYAPGKDDPDKRPGFQRWPNLIQKGDE